MRAPVRRLLSVSALLALTACYRSFDLGPLGDACSTASECGAGNVCTAGVCTQPEPGSTSSGHVRLAQVFTWFPAKWATVFGDQPSRGEYDSADPATIRAQLEAFEYGHIDVGMVDWFGTTYPALGDDALDAVFNVTEDAGVPQRWALSYQPEQVAENSALPESAILEDLSYIASKYAHRGGYWRRDGRFVLFVDTNVTDGCDRISLWADIEETFDAGIGVRPQVFVRALNGATPCARVPSGGWYDYDPGNYTTPEPGVYSMSPGLKYGDGGVRLKRDLRQWEQSVQLVNGSDAGIQYVHSFNMWSEDSSVESAPAWASDSGFGQYLDVLHRYVP